MPRNGSGSYTLPEAAFIPNTAISSSAMNSDLSDIAAGLTDSLARNGEGGMTAVLPLANAGLTYLTDPNTGMRRTAADTQAISAGGVDVITVTPTGASVAGTLAVSGAITSGGATLIPIGVIWLHSGNAAPAKWLLANGGTFLRATYPDLWTFAAAEIAGGNLLYTNGNGSTTFTVPNLNGRVPAGNDFGSGTLTAVTMSPNGNTLGAGGGAQTETLSLANLPTGITSNGSNSISVSTTSADVVKTTGAITSATAGGAVIALPNGLTSVGNVTATGSNPIAVTSNNTGGTGHINVQPTIIVNYIVYAGV